MINWSVSKPKRAGIILCDKKYYYLAVDTNSGDITDFGGKVIYPFEDTLSGAIREFNEETLFTFPNITWMDLYNGEVLIDDDIAIFIVEVRYDVHEYKSKFLEKKLSLQYTEISNIVRISKDKTDEKNDLYRDKIYPLIGNCIRLVI